VRRAPPNADCLRQLAGPEGRKSGLWWLKSPHFGGALALAVPYAVFDLQSQFTRRSGKAVAAT